MDNDPPQLSQFYGINYDKEIGSGISGRVYEGHRIGFPKQEVAIKVIPKTRLSRSSVISTENEVKILLKLDHPNIVKFFNMFEDPGCFYICFERISGGELFDRISKKRHYTELEARNVCKTILSAIKHCHDLDIVHRDLKPENLLMLDEHDDSNLKLIDFGFAAEARGFTLEGLLGTPVYMAPEIYRREKYGKPVDMWAFGVIVYVLLCGYAPFYDVKRELLQKQIIEGTFVFHDDHWSHTSSEAKSFVSQLLNVNLDERMTVDIAYKHPWLMCSESQLASLNISTALQQLRRFNAKRKLRAVVQTIITLRRWKRLFQPTRLDVSPLTSLAREHSKVMDIQQPVDFAAAGTSMAMDALNSLDDSRDEADSLRSQSEVSYPLSVPPSAVKAQAQDRALIDALPPPPLPSLPPSESVVKPISPSPAPPTRGLLPVVVQRYRTSWSEDSSGYPGAPRSASVSSVNSASSSSSSSVPFDCMSLMKQLSSVNDVLTRNISINEAKLCKLSTGCGWLDDSAAEKLTRAIESNSLTIRTNMELIRTLSMYSSELR